MSKDITIEEEGFVVIEEDEVYDILVQGSLPSKKVKDNDHV